ncbi:MAG: MerR family transcriptional regulator [Proteobacteria bacterium]|nr:MerR family transcriptional regulator [Pseudomonadota bacterium]
MSIEDVRSYRDQGLLQRPRRQRSRTDDFAFQAEHVERLQFIKRALQHGLTVSDIARIVDPGALVTCGDVYTVTARRLEQVRQSGGGDTPVAAALAKLLDVCRRVGSRQECEILVALSKPGAPSSSSGCCG